MPQVAYLSIETLLACIGIPSYLHLHRLLACCVVSVGQDRFFLRGKLISEISLEENLSYQLPDLFFGHGASMRARPYVRKPFLRAQRW
jgi:hypothetical protein